MNHNLPIFCDNCATLALAELDSAPLCGACLMRALSQSSHSLTSKIKPLEFNEPKIIERRFSLPRDAA